MRKLVCFIQYIFLIVSGESERLFENLKKRFSKRRTAVKKAKRSGVGRIDLQKAEEELNKYAFLEWIIPCIAVKDSISNLDVTSGIGGSGVGINEGFEANDELEEKEQDESDNGEDVDGDDDDKEIEVKTPKRKREIETKDVKSNPANEIKWKKKRVSPDELMLTISERLNERSETKSKPVSENCDDAETIFGKMVADELRALPKKMKIMLKHDINESIFKYQMQLEEDNERSKHAIQPPEPTDLRNSTGFAPISFNNNNVNVNPFYRTFPVPETHSQTTSGAGVVDGIPQASNIYRQLLEE